MIYEFAAAGRIVFGRGVFGQAGERAAALGRRPLVVAGSHPRLAELVARLDAQGLETSRFTVQAEPTIEKVRQGTELARDHGCDMVIGLGGGSVLDAGKAIAALLANPGEPLDYLEVIGRGRPLANPAIPYLAVPTTAGTGSETTSNAVLGSPEHGVKVSMRSPHMLPRLALVDPELTLSMPPDVTASTGLDALTQVIEPFVSQLANPLTDPLCLEGIRRAARSLSRAYEQPDDIDARSDMAFVSLCGGLALSNAKLGAVHGFAGPFGGMYASPHGAVCAALLPHVTAANIGALRQRQPESEALRRYGQVARILTGDASAEAEDGARWLHALIRRLRVPSLRSYGFVDAEAPALVEKAARASSMKGNAIVLTEQEMIEIVLQA